MSAFNRPLAYLALVAGGLSLALLALSSSPRPPDPAQVTDFVAAHRTALILLATLVLAWSTCSVPFVVYLGKHMHADSSPLVATAQTLTVAGLLMVGFATFVSVGAMLALASAVPAPSPEVQSYQFRFWSHFGFFLSDPGLLAWGLGQFLYGWHSLKSGVFPRWVSVVALFGGVAGLLTLAVYQTPLLALAQLLLFAVWSLAIGIVVLREQRHSIRSNHDA